MPGQTLVHLIAPEGSGILTQVTVPDDPCVHDLGELVLPFFPGTKHVQRLYVICDGHQRLMFVDEAAHERGLPENVAATALYRDWQRKRHPKIDVNTFPTIAGYATVFNDPVVWRQW